MIQINKRISWISIITESISRWRVLNQIVYDSTYMPRAAWWGKHGQKKKSQKNLTFCSTVSVTITR